jgi:hypothetical protein
VGIDRRLAVASCDELARAKTIVDTATGGVVSASGTGPVLGVAESRVIAYDVCPGFPCGVSAVDPDTGVSESIVACAGPASGGGSSLVLLLGLSAVALWLPGSDLVAASAAGTVGDGSASRAGVDRPRLRAARASGDRPTVHHRLLDPAASVIETLECSRDPRHPVRCGSEPWSWRSAPRSSSPDRSSAWPDDPAGGLYDQNWT